MCFNWNSLREIEDCPFGIDNPIPGKLLEVELLTGAIVEVPRANEGGAYFCHGLTFGGKEAPDGPVSPLVRCVRTILREHYSLLAEAEAQPGDILVWRGLDADEFIHSAILTAVVLTSDSLRVDYTARLQTKNGKDPERNDSLNKIVFEYGESYMVYRKM